jgi:hypothetical protein
MGRLEDGEGGCVYATLMVSDTLHPYVRAEEDKRPGRARKKPNDLSACECDLFDGDGILGK